MEKVDLILWIVSSGFGLNFALLLVIWNRIEKLDEKMTDIDRRVCRIEGAISSKESCMLKDDRIKQKAE